MTQLELRNKLRELFPELRLSQQKLEKVEKLFETYYEAKSPTIHIEKLIGEVTYVGIPIDRQGSSFGYLDARYLSRELQHKLLEAIQNFPASSQEPVDNTEQNPSTDFHDLL